MARNSLLYMAQAKAGPSLAEPDATGPGKALRDEAGRHAPGKATMRGAGREELPAGWPDGLFT